MIEGFTVKLTDAIPKNTSISAVIGIVFYNDQEILVIKNRRGWDFPGGHVEPNETPEAALHRELMEETYATINDPQLFMSATLDQTMLFYTAQIGTLLPFLGEHETTERALMTPANFLTIYKGGLPELAHHAINRALLRF